MMNIWTKFLKKYKLGEERTKYIGVFIKRYITTETSILDIGCGGCKISKYLKESGYKVIPIDVKDKSKIKTISPKIFDGKKLPFKNNSFDVSIIIAVLHHTKNPEDLLEEAARVSDCIIVMEDIYTNILKKYLTYFIDSLVNFEFFNHPHMNKSDREWKRIFEEQNLKLIKAEYGNIWGVFSEAFYCLKKQ